MDSGRLMQSFQASDFDVAIVGGGLVGCAIGYGLTRLGQRVVILDEGDIAYRASRGNFGLIWVQGKGAGLPAYSSWTQLSARRWPELAELLQAETGIDVGLEQPGGMHVCLSERELEYRITSLNNLMHQPDFERYEFEVLDHAALARYIPGIGRDVTGATYSRLDGHVNPLRLLRALHTAFVQCSGTYRPDHEVRAIARETNAFLLETAHARFRAARVVLASGLGNATLAPSIGLRVPVRPQRGQIIVLERMRPFIPCPIVTLRQTDEGTVLIGDSQEETGFDESVGAAVLATLADRAVRTFPHLRDVRVTRTWAALRVMSPDGFPIYEQSVTQPGAFVATCHSGVTLAAAHAFVLAPSIVAGELIGLRDFSLERFDVLQAA
jgi:hydrogen cyanide synthase HcnC